MLSADSTDERNTKKVISVSRFYQSNYANLDQDKILKIIPRKFLGLAKFIGICSKECSNKIPTPTLSVLFVSDRALFKLLIQYVKIYFKG